MEEGSTAAAAVVVVVVGAATSSTGNGAAKSSTGNGAPAEVSVAVVVAAVAVPRRDDRRTNLAVVAGRCGVPQRPATWPRTRAAPQSTASVTATARAADPGRSCPLLTPSIWPPRWRIP